MRITFVARDAGHASSRVRALQYVEPLRQLGHTVSVQCWQPRSSIDVATSTAALLRASTRSDVVILVKPRLHPAALAALRRVNPAIVVDVDDAVWTWLPPFPERFERAAKVARVITAGNRFLRGRLADEYPDTQVVQMPTAVDCDRYEVQPPSDNAIPVVGWIGGPASLTDFVDPVARVLADLVEAQVIRLRIVSSRPLDPSVAPSEFEPWSADGEMDALRRFDIGIMPLADDEQSWGRCGLKALQYMAAGRPVVASPVGAAVEIVEDGRCGMLAASPSDWHDALTRLARDAELRARTGDAARRRVETHFSLEAVLPILVDALQQACAP